MLVQLRLVQGMPVWKGMCSAFAGVWPYRAGLPAPPHRAAVSRSRDPILWDGLYHVAAFRSMGPHTSGSGFAPCVVYRFAVATDDLSGFALVIRF